MSTQLPPELVDIIISEFWYSEPPSKDRTAFMRACPLINNLWKDVFARIASRDIYLPTVPYLVYLSSIIRTDNSVIYRHFLPSSTRTMNCCVGLTESTSDSAMEPYAVLCSLPNHIGFRRCFPNLHQINLKINYRIQRGLSTFALRHHQLVRTRISIHLDKAPTQLSVIPLDWDIILEHPDAEYVRNDCYWSMFVREAISAMAPGVLCCIWRPSFPDIISNSAYEDDLMRFYGHVLLSERRGDVQDINYRFRKAARRPLGLWAILAEVYEDIRELFDEPRLAHSYWKPILAE
ncbi:hypothetical protein ARMSODRAFT_955160 [Armillaria solidipes]|uniref:F-box domain-containing protein n=1 Tax=Armillaria solidipes TaxID=1076256 RepID=A0A2H3BKH1_9AGAR|nr:hypothetical protein ARMSODRAFT_955160 [Armillaria solidipes]